MNATEVISRTECACTDIACGIVDEFKHYPKGVDETYRETLTRLTNERVNESVMTEIIADLVYDDPGYLKDFIGDMIYGKQNRTQILDELEGNSHYAQVVKELRG